MAHRGNVVAMGLYLHIWVDVTGEERASSDGMGTRYGGLGTRNERLQWTGDPV